MKLFAVFLRDVRSPSHLGQLRRERMTSALVAGIGLAALILAEYFDSLHLGKAMRRIPIAGIAPSLLLVIGLSRASVLFSAERREGTLPLLLLTHLTGFDIVLGKVLQALVTEGCAFLAVLPMLVLPFCEAGLNLTGSSMACLSSLNILFYGLAVGTFASVWADGAKASAVCFLCFLPVIVLSSPVGFLLPGRYVAALLAMLSWANPLEAPAHLTAAAAGIRTASFWTPLLSSHVMAWGWLGLAGMALPRACRWEQGRDLGQQKQRKLLSAAAKVRQASSSTRTRLLNTNPFLWLCYRRRWPTVKMWAVLGFSSFAWSGLAFLTWAGPGVNIIYIAAMAASACWGIALLAGVPAEAAWQLVEDRNSGALELVLCTPTSEKPIIQGIWLDLSRRFLPPLTAVLVLATVLGLAGYATQGFGMLETEDMSPWLFGWMTGILLLPLMLISLCWAAMRRALFARNAGEASALSFLYLIVLPTFAFGTILGILDNKISYRGAVVLVALFAFSLILRAHRARAALFANLRQAAADRYTPAKEEQTPPFVRLLRRNVTNGARCLYQQNGSKPCSRGT